MGICLPFQKTKMTIDISKLSTRTAVTLDLMEKGIPADLADTIAGLSGCQRHEERVEFLLGEMKRDSQLVIWSLLDQIGIGGTAGLEGAASERVPALRGIPRKQSRSGSAWSAALAEAVVRFCAGEPSNGYEYKLDPFRLTVEGPKCDPTLILRGPEDERELASLDVLDIPYAWRYALACHAALWHAAPHRPEWLPAHRWARDVGLESLGVIVQRNDGDFIREQIAALGSRAAVEWVGPEWQVRSSEGEVLGSILGNVVPDELLEKLTATGPG